MAVNQEIAGNLPSESDTVVYKVTLDSAGFVILDFLHENLHEKHRGWLIQLADDSSDGIVECVSHWNDLKVSSPAIGLPAGTYWITISSPAYGDPCHWNATQYKLAVRFTAASDWETEFNGSYKNADAIQVNSPVTGTLRTDYDVDVYTFTLDSPGFVHLEFSHKNQVTKDKGWRVVLYDDRSNELNAITSRWNETLNTSTSLSLPAGMYFISIRVPNSMDYHPEWNAEKYTLKVNFTSDLNALKETLPSALLSEGRIQDAQLVSFLIKKNPDLENAYASELIDRYIAEAIGEGVNYEIAIAQMCFHTNYLRFTKTIATKGQNNFFGLVYDDKRTAYAFESMELGIRAHIQHLKAYATADPLVQECVDPRYSIVKHGIAPTLDGLDGRWAGTGYADKIRDILSEMKK